jgi:glyoxylase-like metal-dependent hydrolase (beta-lactamase superfamily II)
VAIKRRYWIPLTAIAVLLVVLGIAKHVLLDTAAEPRGTFVIDLDALHRAAVRGGTLPQRIEVERVGEFSFPQTMVVAGGGFRMHPMVLLSHRVVWPDRSIVIDSAMSPEDAKSLPSSHIDQAAYARMQAALGKADATVFTHEHPDHVGGVARAPNFKSLASEVLMTREQLTAPKLDRSLFPAGAFDDLKPIDYQGLYAVAGGVVLQKAPGHSVGSQLIYVELASGTRFLFVGDIAWSKDNIREQKGRPGFADLFMKEDRGAVAAQVKALGQLPADVHVIVAHDPVALEDDLRAGLYRQGFTGL